MFIEKPFGTTCLEVSAATDDPKSGVDPKTA